MDTSKLVPNDSRVRELSAQVRGKTYTYLLGEPRGGQPRDTIFLLHGFPDIPFGWRHQVPYLISLGFRVVVPNLLGYAGTSRPDDLAAFSCKNMSEDLRELAAQVVGRDRQIILGGHDWGGVLAWRAVLWCPELIKLVFSICTPFIPPNSYWVELEDLIAAGHLTNFKYQLQLAGRDVESGLQTEEKIWQMLNGCFGGMGPNQEVALTTADGLLMENLPILGPSPLASVKELNYSTQQFMRQPSPPMRGPLNWYRTRKINHDDELALVDAFEQVRTPALFISASKDEFLPPALSAGMDDCFENLTRGEVNTSHWAMLEAPAEVNKLIGDWLSKELRVAIKPSL